MSVYKHNRVLNRANSLATLGRSGFGSSITGQEALSQIFQKEKYSIDYSKSPSQHPAKENTPAGFPPLNGTMRPLEAPELPQDNTEMAPNSIEKVLGTATDEGRNHKKLSNTNFNKLKALIEKLEVNYEQAVQANEEANEKIASLETELADLKKKLATKKKGKKQCRKDEAKDDVIAAIKSFINVILFRNYKFCHTDDLLHKACVMVWNGIKDEHKLESGPDKISLTDFAEIYSSHVAQALNQRRQYAQTRAEVAAKGKKLSSVLSVLFILRYFCVLVLIISFLLPRMVGQSQRRFAHH